MKIPETKKRMIKAIDAYLDYAESIIEKGGSRYTISKAGKSYNVDMNTMDCSCMDFQHRGTDTPCKHIVIMFLYRYFKHHDDLSEIPG